MCVCIYDLSCSAMSTVRIREELGPITRNRSSSANEASKPSSILHRRQTHVGNKPLNFSPSAGKCIVDHYLHHLIAVNHFIFEIHIIHIFISFLKKSITIFFSWFSLIYNLFQIFIYFAVTILSVHSYTHKRNKVKETNKSNRNTNVARPCC